MHDSAFHTQDSIQGEEPANLAKAREIEDIADSLLADCLTVAGAHEVNANFDLYDGSLLPALMSAIANWNGRSDSANTTMQKLHNILCNKLHTVAEAIEQGVYK